MICLQCNRQFSGKSHECSADPLYVLRTTQKYCDEFQKWTNNTAGFRAEYQLTRPENQGRPARDPSAAEIFNYQIDSEGNGYIST